MPSGLAPRVFDEPPPEARELPIEEFLTWLGQPAIFHLRGERSDRVRVLSGGLHGNEPSGFYALHELLKSPPRLPCDAVLVLGNVPAALYELLFTHRFVPGQEDFNRVWGHREGNALREIAGRIYEYLAPLPCESFVDLHNNTGHNPIYGVVLEPDRQRVALGRPWTHRFVLYEGTKMGTFLEVCEPKAPGVVIECGQAGDPRADRRALEGARHYLAAEDAYDPDRIDGREFFYRSTARVTVPPEVQLAFSARRTVADLTISPDIDRYNFEVMEEGTRLAYCNGRGHLTVIGNDGSDVTRDYLETREGAIYLKRSLIPVMMTTDAVSAKCDCLLYAAERLDVGPAPS